ncbi:MAG: hypothetical protein HW403_649 [Dehalococcoidia bacterium]|nr:hypothetical protein [Dehalococcoidia bacterium]
MFLVLEWGLVTLARVTTYEAEKEAVKVILDGIQIGSALGVASLFVIHFVAVALDFGRYLFRT